MRVLLFLLSLPLWADPQMFPLEAGNYWIYRERSTLQQVTVSVAAPVLIGGKVYHPLRGYVTESVLARFNEFRNLVYLNEQTGAEHVLTGFETGGWFEAPLRGCQQLSQAQPVRAPFQGPAGVFAAVLSIRYRSIACADAGTEDERYVPNVGRIQFSVQSLAGPRLFDLVSAKVGKLRLEADSGATFSVSVSPVTTPRRTRVTLSLSTHGLPVRLVFPTAQTFDVVVRGADGTLVWRGVEGDFFAQGLREETLMERRWSIDIPGGVFPPGAYQVEARLFSGVDGTQFASTGTFVAQ